MRCRRVELGPTLIQGATSFFGGEFLSFINLGFKFTNTNVFIFFLVMMIDLFNKKETRIGLSFLREGEVCQI